MPPCSRSWRGRRAVTAPPLAEVAGVLDDARHDALERALGLVRSQGLHTLLVSLCDGSGASRVKSFPAPTSRASRAPASRTSRVCSRSTRAPTSSWARASTSSCVAAASCCCRPLDADADALVARHRRDHGRRVLRGRQARRRHPAQHGAPAAGGARGERSRDLVGLGVRVLYLPARRLRRARADDARLPGAAPGAPPSGRAAARRAAVMLAPAGIELDDAIHEYGPGQLEVNFPPGAGSPRSTARSSSSSRSRRSSRARASSPRS